MHVAAETKLSFQDKGTYGSIAAKKIVVGGKLAINGKSNIDPKEYVIFESRKKRIGEFGEVKFKGFGKGVKPKIVYSKKAVKLVVSK